MSKRQSITFYPVYSKIFADIESVIALHCSEKRAFKLEEWFLIIIHASKKLKISENMSYF